MKKQLFVAMTALSLTFTAIPSLAPIASAATVTASEKGVFWGNGNFVGSVGSVFDNGYAAEAQAVKFTPKSGATYTAISDNSNVVKVTGIKIGYDEVAYTDNGKVFITGVTKGSANITLKETINGKTKVVGKTKVTIVPADISAYSNYKHEFGLGAQNSQLKFVNRNDSATYTFKANKPGLTFSTQKEEEGYHSIQMNATEYGTYVVTASETVNGKTRKIKDITFIIGQAQLPDTITVNSEAVFVEERIKFLDMNYEYGLYIKGQTVFRMSGNGYVPFDYSNVDKSQTDDYAVFTSADSGIEKIGTLIANKAATVTADLYRSKRGSKGTEEVEFLKTVKVTFKF